MKEKKEKRKKKKGTLKILFFKYIIYDFKNVLIVFHGFCLNIILKNLINKYNTFLIY